MLVLRKHLNASCQHYGGSNLKRPRGNSQPSAGCCRDLSAYGQNTKGDIVIMHTAFSNCPPKIMLALLVYKVK